ncbi:MAG: hypothetical protein ACPG4X_14505 [Pikeienuella sp.]
MSTHLQETSIETNRPSREVQLVHDAVPMLDTGKFEHMQRLATVIARSSLIPKHLVVANDLAATQANCFRVVNQAVRWGFDPFAVVDETYVVYGKLGYQGKLIAAVVNAKAGLKSRLKYTYNDAEGDDLEITVSGTFESEDEEREVFVRVGDAKTDNPMWEADPRQKLIYSGAIKWARAHCPELILGLLTDDDIDRMKDMGSLVPAKDGAYAPPRPAREDFDHAAAGHVDPAEQFAEHMGDTVTADGEVIEAETETETTETQEPAEDRPAEDATTSTEAEASVDADSEPEDQPTSAAPGPLPDLPTRPNKKQWDDWIAAAMATLKTASKDEAGAFEKDNRAVFRRLSEYDPDAANALVDQMNERLTMPDDELVDA